MKIKLGILVGVLIYLAIVYPLPRMIRFPVHAAMTIALTLILARLWERTRRLEAKAASAEDRLRQIDEQASAVLQSLAYRRLGADKPCVPEERRVMLMR